MWIKDAWYWVAISLRRTWVDDHLTTNNKKKPTGTEKLFLSATSHITFTSLIHRRSCCEVEYHPKKIPVLYQTLCLYQHLLKTNICQKIFVTISSYLYAGKFLRAEVSLSHLLLKIQVTCIIGRCCSVFSWSLHRTQIVQNTVCIHMTQ